MTDELVQLHDAAHLLRSLPDAKIPGGSVKMIKRLIQNTVAIGSVD